MITLLIAIFLGGMAQRATGMGLALVAAPFIVVALGPAAGVVVANLLGVVGSAMVYARVRHAVDWRMLRLMLPAALVGVAAGTALAEVLPEAWAQVFIGALVLVALLVSSFAAFERLERTPKVTAVASAASGATSALAGIGGPAMAVLRILTRWEHLSFTATLQPFFFGISTVVVLARVSVNPGAWPDLGWGWLLIAFAMATGIALGDVVARRLSARVLNASITIVAALGAVWTMLDGIAGL
ncbi:MAG TPA: sulfite exporter TauE/SafE family protein [Actinomycetaceae bacterium]|nr:sulfite exporter TauE/SafE family protein [Actinomycetaceae bacterium]